MKHKPLLNCVYFSRKHQQDHVFRNLCIVSLFQFKHEPPLKIQEGRVLDQHGIKQVTEKIARSVHYNFTVTLTAVYSSENRKGFPTSRILHNKLSSRIVHISCFEHVELGQACRYVQVGKRIRVSGQLQCLSDHCHARCSNGPLRREQIHRRTHTNNMVEHNQT